MRVPLQLALLAAPLVLAACAAATQWGGSLRDPNRLTAIEIQAVSAHSALDAVRQLRAVWLRGRRSSSVAPVVYVDNVRMGGPAVLERIWIQNVSELWFMSGLDATTRYGTGHTGGAILVFTRHST